jgi:thiol-disulfide isomerase/thioredoxin
VTAPAPAPRRAGAGGVLLVALVLAASAAGGFLVHRLAAPRPTQLYPLAAQGAGSPAPAPPPPDSAPLRRIPERLPQIELPGLDGAPQALSNWSNRPLLVNFWATWCEPCRREIPLLKSLRRAHAAEKLEIVGVALDSAEAVRQYASGHGIDYPVLVGESGGLEAANAFGMDTVLPFSVFADRSGRIVTVKVGELHRDEANLILDRMRDVELGRISLPTARAQISQGIERLAARP